MDDDRPDPRCLQKGDVAREGTGELRIAHGMATIFHHHDLAVVAEHVGECRGDQPRPRDRVAGFLVDPLVHRLSCRSKAGRVYNCFETCLKGSRQVARTFDSSISSRLWPAARTIVRKVSVEQPKCELKRYRCERVVSTAVYPARS